MGNAKRDDNYIPTLLAVSNADGTTPVTLYADPTTHRLLVSATLGTLDDLSDVVITSGAQGDILYNNGTNWVNLAAGSSGLFLKTQGAGANPVWDTAGSGSGTVTSVSVVTANGISGSVATATTTPAITLTLGAITPSSVNISGLTASEIVITDSSKNLASAAVVTYPSLTELTYVKGVTSAIQTQINTKQATLTNSAGLAAALSDETGTGLVVFNNSPTFVDDITIGGAGVATGQVKISGTTSGTVVITVPAIAGTPTYTLPAAVGGVGTFLKDAAGNGILSWAVPSGSGDVSKVGTPVNDQIGVWTGDGTIEGDAALTYNATTDTLTSVAFAGNLTGNVTGNVSGTAATVTGAAQVAITSLGTLTALQVDNISLDLNTISSTTGALNITPVAGSAIVLDGTISIDAGVVTGATSITSTAFVGDLTGTASGNLVSGGALGTPASGVATNLTGLPLTTGVTGVLPVANGGTGKSSWTQWLIPYADTTTSFAQIAIGTSGQVLTSNGAGVAPTFQAAAGGGNTYFNNQHIDQSGGTSDTYGVLSGAINGSNTLFTVSQAVYATGTLSVYLNGQLQTQGSGEDWVETIPTSGTFTFAVAPPTGSLITVEYQTVALSEDTVLVTGDIGVTIQPYDADLAVIAGLTATTNNFIVSVASAWASRTPSEVKTTLSLNLVENTALSTWAGSANVTTLGTLTTLTVDDITINGNTISSAGASTLAITPTAGQVITFDGTVTLDAGVIAGATSITSTTFIGALTGTASGNLVSGGALGTPSSGTLTNCTGLPVAGLVALTASEMVGTNASGFLVSLAVATYPSLTELTYVKGVTSAIQTQLGLKAPLASPTFTGTVTIPTPFTIGAVSMTATGTELNYVAGVTSAIQTQLDAKLALAGGTLTGNITLGEGADPSTIGIVIDASMSADERYSGITIPGTAGATLAFGDICYLDVTATEWLLADASAESTAGSVVLGICVDASTDGAATSMLLIGTVRSAAFPASIALGAPVYVSETAGDITATQPVAVDSVIRICGWAVTAEPNTIYFNPSSDYIIHV